MKKILISILALGCIACLKPNSQIMNVSGVKKANADDESSEDFYEEEDYMYDDFLDEVFNDASMTSEDEKISMRGTTSDVCENFNFGLDFYMDTLSYSADFYALGITMEYNDATVDETGRLDAEIIIDNTESGNYETYKVSDYRDMRDLEKFVKDSITGTSATTSNLPSPCFAFSFGAVIAAIVSAFVVVTETAEQVKARTNYRYNEELENMHEGVNYRNYITNQREDWLEGYKSANYKFGFAEFKDVGCEVAAVYNLMISNGTSQPLSEVIYNFEKWAIEFSVGWGYLGSNPRDIYRYLRNKGISYKRNSVYGYFENRVSSAFVGTDFIMSTINSNGIGLHTYYFRKEFDYLLTYNFNAEDSPVPYQNLDSIYDETGLFIVGYTIND